jgi:GT2 family glycosyltransferase
MVTILKDVSLIMCSWNRPWYIYPSLKSFSKQTNLCDFIIWNNNPKFVKEVEEAVNKFDPMPVKVIHHDNKPINETHVYKQDVHGNLGGFARFYAAREFGREYVIFVDDDWEMKPDFIKFLYENRREDAIVGTWGWNYNQRAERARVVKGSAHYIGTCGLIAPRTIFENEGLYKEVPQEYWFLEDIWLCFFARCELGYKVEACGKLERIARNMNRDEKGNLVEKTPGLSNKLWNIKPKFVKYLLKRFGRSG